MRRITILFAALLFAVSMLATPAAADHQHYIDTPQDTRITLPCEPEGTAAAAVHPMHNGLHMSPSSDARVIDVDHYGRDTCDDPQLKGPAR